MEDPIESATQPQAETEMNDVAKPSVTTILEILNAPSSKILYSPIREGEIRLVTIHAGNSEDNISCSLSTVSQNGNPHYWALSYVWGSQEDPKSILLDNIKWHVTRNLYTALSHLRKQDEDVIVWIDALAINQSDIPERNVQVSSMRNVYSQASSTFIWLCDADHEFDPGVEAYFAASQAWFTANADLRSEMEETYKRSIAADDGIGWLLKKTPIIFTRLPYWSRTWIFWIGDTRFVRRMQLTQGTEYLVIMVAFRRKLGT